MITLLNRKKLLSTSNAEIYSQVLDILSANKVDYKVEFYRSGRTFMRERGDGMLGMNQNATDMYSIYVKTKEFEKARYLIRMEDLL